MQNIDGMTLTHYDADKEVGDDEMIAINAHYDMISGMHQSFLDDVLKLKC